MTKSSAVMTSTVTTIFYWLSSFWTVRSARLLIKSQESVFLALANVSVRFSNVWVAFTGVFRKIWSSELNFGTFVSRNATFTVNGRHHSLDALALHGGNLNAINFNDDLGGSLISWAGRATMTSVK